MATSPRHRDALRLLFILVKGSQALTDPHPSGAKAVFRGEARLHALDFWVRNPDYLADELLSLFEQTGDEHYRSEVEQIFAQDEPDIRRLPMVRYFFGAYERLDDVLALLVCRGLVKITGTKSGEKVTETSFLVLPAAFDLAKSIVSQYPVLEWYARRACLVVSVAGSRGGAALKDRQYEQAEYAQTKLGGIIPPITARVRERLAALSAAKAEGT